MKFYKIYDLAINEMARTPKSEQFGKVTINTNIQVTPEKITNIKMYPPLDQFDDIIKAKIFNFIVQELKDTTFDGYEELYKFVSDKIGEGIKAEGGKYNSTQLKYTTRVVFNTLGPNRLGVIVPMKGESEVTPEQPSEGGKSTKNGKAAVEDTVVDKGNKKGVYIIDNDRFLSDGIDRLQGLHPAVLEALTTFFELHNGESMPDMKLRLSIAKEVEDSLGGISEDIQKKIMRRLKQDNMASLIINLKASKAIHSPNEKKSGEYEEVPLLDIGEDELEDILSADVERLTGGYGPRGDDYEVSRMSEFE